MNFRIQLRVQLRFIMKENLYKYILGIADNTLILGQRLGELCGHGPSLEIDIACTNISLDLLGQTRSYYQYAAKIKGDNSTEDDIAFLRKEREYVNLLLVEQPNKDFAHTMARQFLFDVYHLLLLQELEKAFFALDDISYFLKFAIITSASLSMLRMFMLWIVPTQGYPAKKSPGYFSLTIRLGRLVLSLKSSLVVGF